MSRIATKVRSALFDITAREPSESPRLVSWTICGLVGVLILWAVVARLDIVAIADGRLVPQTYVKIVQPADAGIVREILVKEGDAVQAGQVLVRLDSTFASADRRSVASQLALKRLELRRIDAQLAARRLMASPDDDTALFAQVQLDAAARERSHLDQIAQEQSTLERTRGELSASRETLAKLERTLPSYQEAATAYAKLAEEKLVGRLTAEEKKREAVERAQDLSAQAALVASLESSRRAQEHKVAQLRSAYASALQSERVQVVAEITRLTEEATKHGFREGLLELRAPQDGVVNALATTTAGAVVQPGTVLVTLVPKDERLVAEVFIRNQDIGFVAEGQPARLKLAAYPFTKYGMLEGRVVTISADAADSEGANSRRSADDEEHEAARFKAIIELGAQRLLASNLELPIGPGMQVSAEIRQGQRTVLEYLLSPVQRIGNEAGRER